MSKFQIANCFVTDANTIPLHATISSPLIEGTQREQCQVNRKYSSLRSTHTTLKTCHFVESAEFIRNKAGSPFCRPTVQAHMHLLLSSVLTTSICWSKSQTKKIEIHFTSDKFTPDCSYAWLRDDLKKVHTFEMLHFRSPLNCR